MRHTGPEEDSIRTETKTYSNSTLEPRLMSRVEFTMIATEDFSCVERTTISPTVSRGMGG